MRHSSSCLLSPDSFLLPYPETRQVYNFDCGANALMSMLCYAGIEEREDRIAFLAGTTKRDGTSTAGVLRVLGYYGLPHQGRRRMRPEDLRRAIDRGWPTMIAIQAYRESSLPYRQLWGDGHWVVAIGYERVPGQGCRILFEDPSAFHRTWLADAELRQRWHDLDRGGRRIVGWGCTLEVAGHYEHDRHVHMD